MNIIPIVFCFDDNLLLPAGVCITSLLEHALDNTFYDIFILHDETVKYPNSGFLEKLNEKFNNFSITYRSVGSQFIDGFEIRGITVATYYRLLIPDLIPEHDKIMYHDVDVIFRSDLSNVFLNTQMEGYYAAGVVSPAALEDEMYTIRKKMGLNPDEYIIGGNLIFNSQLMRKDDIVKRLVLEAKRKYTYQDQDVLNIVCKNKIKRMPPSFGGAFKIFDFASRGIEQHLYSAVEFQEMLNNGTIHYNGPKPWKGWCPNFDVWWEYYRNSVYYDHEFYFDFYYTKLGELDQLSLWKRLKLLLRYFKTFSLRK